MAQLILLPHGKVLMAGSCPAASRNAYCGSGHTATAEFYDPAADSRSNTAAMGELDGMHSAILLLTGRVLVAAGSTNGSALNFAEIFDPGLGYQAAWQPTITSGLPAPAGTNPKAPGSNITLNGSNLTGILGSASGGSGEEDSKSNYPLIFLRKLDGDGASLLSTYASCVADGVSGSSSWPATPSAPATPISCWARPRLWRRRRAWPCRRF